jgi:hypothetical protein
MRHIRNCIWLGSISIAMAVGCGGGTGGGGGDSREVVGSGAEGAPHAAKAAPGLKTEFIAPELGCPAYDWVQVWTASGSYCDGGGRSDCGNSCPGFGNFGGWSSGGGSCACSCWEPSC